MSRDIGVPGINPPKAKECLDSSCPFHGSTKIRGKILQGIVVSKKTKNTVILRRDYIQFIKKYQRCFKPKTKQRRAKEKADNLF